MSTYMAKNEEVERNWYVVDAEDKTLGRISSKIAQYLRGKHKPTFTPHVDMGDFVIVVNAEKIKLTGNKWDQKKYYRHSNYIGGIKEMTYKELLEKDPEFIIEKAVKGMLPGNKLGRKMIKKLKVYSGDSHPHQAQKPEKLEL
ncbi:50S ribosomal protein L13 [Halanaerobium sp. Z-7514]|uniref:Large ribosomal subunit protein uL13 n=1 Tax=Halanaerobium polyolivorans TaxID=2886943 RepID=A0AAW4WZM3_9FIRM|nr:50S ribosomal protein L13 [Halanaerobium polyolivorans]MCC3145050.1 50S ribosomal protein L13 [Halanaerobium polyolivorans]RQD72488.1 MAG: 50S ribosomal protein L13 [Halanaerobium sp. MSAO_Bac5]